MAFPQANYLKVGPYLDAFQGVRTALKINEGIIKVVGAEGVGKSALCKQLVSELEAENQDVIYFETPPQSPDDLYQHIQSVLGLDKNKDFNRALTRYLLETSTNRKLLIIYNDAEQISKDLFILIRLLNNIHDDSKTLVSQIITGTNKLDRLFDDPALRSLTQYLNQSFTLSPMTREQLDDFYSAYKKDTGVTDKTMGNKELTELYLLSKGLPGKTIEILNDFFTVKELVVEPVADKPEVAESEQDSPLLNITEFKPENEPVSVSLLSDATIEIHDKETDAEAAPAVERPAAVLPTLVLPTLVLPTLEIPTSELPVEEPPEKILTEQEFDSQKSIKKIDTQESFLSDLEFITRDPKPPVATDIYIQVVNEILDDDVESLRTPAPALLKICLSAVVVMVTMILAFVFSGNNETVNNKLTEILVVKAPLYMDEITADVESINPAPSITPLANVPANDNQSPNLSNGLETNITETIFSETSNSETASLIEENPAQENTVSELDTPVEIVTLDTPAATSNAALEIPALDNSEIDLVPESVAEDVIENEADLNNLLKQQISGTLTRWISAWQAGDFDNYLAVYHESFEPFYHDSYDSWLAQRRGRIQGAQGITISYDRLEFIELSGDEALVRFWLQYARGSYADDTMKEIRFLVDGDSWLIQSERNLEIINQAP